MKIVLATGIYPPDIGGPATYVQNLARELIASGHQITVITYGEEIHTEEKWNVIRVSKSGPIIRWFRYARALKEHAHDADVVYAFSSVSCGVPLVLSGVRNPKKILRLGGDFLWERYTDRGGRKSLREWYKNPSIGKGMMQWLLNTFDHIVFSTRFQEEIYEKAYPKLPSHSVIENAFVAPAVLSERNPLKGYRLLFMGRLVPFKNLNRLITSLHSLSDVLLTIVGDGPEHDELMKFVSKIDLDDRIVFVHPVHGKEKEDLFAIHNLLVLPSLTEISPHVALEAAASGLPVLLTEETGLSSEQTQSMYLRKLESRDDIVTAITEVRNLPAPQPNQLAFRSWKALAEDHVSLFTRLV